MLNPPTNDFCAAISLNREILDADVKDLEDLVDRFLDMSPPELANYSGSPSVVLCCQFLCYAKRVVTLRRPLLKEKLSFERLQDAILRAPAARPRKAVEEDVPAETA